jgi:hypothetical protein
MAFVFRLETAEGVPAEPPTLSSAVPSPSSGDELPSSRGLARFFDQRLVHAAVRERFE